MVLAGLYVVVEGLRALIDGSHAEESAFGIVLAALSIAVLPRLEDALLGIKPPDADLVSAARADFAPLLFSDEIANDTRREP
jgi:hypothetical protein